MTKATSGVSARLTILAAAALFSTGGAAIKACQLNAWQVASFRSGVAAVFLVLAWRGVTGWRERRVWLVGLAYAATMVLYVVANKLTTAANSIFLQSTAPLYVMLIGPWLIGETIRRRDLLLSLLLAIGLATFFVGVEPPLATAPDPRLGNLVGAASGLTWALTLIGLRWLGRQPGGEAHGGGAVIVGNLLACLICLSAALPVVSTRPLDAALIGYLGVGQIGLAYVLLTRGLGRVPAIEASLLLLLEPVLNPLWSWIVHHEQPGGWSLAGGALILTATLAHVAGSSRVASRQDGGGRGDVSCSKPDSSGPGRPNR
ncbi:MAG: DMT family transporter [Acidobacteriota bacterium]|nr:MAG: DMT family transporter [Acidobacteriota bacterium]